MSLLMKALEKAAKDRLEPKAAGSTAAAGTAAAAAGGSARSELTLEPIVAAQAEQAAAPATVTAQPARARAPAALNGSPAAPPPSSREPAEAATVVRAGQPAATAGMLNYLRDRPLVAFGMLTTLFIIGYGIYVYVQLNPASFTRPAPRAAASAPVAQAPAPGPVPAAGVIQGSPVLAPPPTPLVSLLPPPQETTGAEKPARPAPAPPAPKIKSAANVDAQSAVAATPAPAPPPRDTIKVTAGGAAPAINPLLAQAYSALTAGDFELSRQLYGELLKSDPANIDAALGLASIATQQGDRDAATRLYISVLALDPRNDLAQAGLIGIVGRADPLSAETRIKQLIARDPSAAYLYFTLGNTYVDQKRWPDAQQAYFQAHHLQPDNPDYAYNLAVALEHIGQPRPALDYYRRAVQLAAAKGRANFSTAAAQERVARLEKIVP